MLIKLQVLYLSGDGDPLWFTTGKGSDELIPTGALPNSIPHRIFSQSVVLIYGDGREIISVYTLWKHPTLLPVLTTPALVIPILVGGADLMIPGGARA